MGGGSFLRTRSRKTSYESKANATKRTIIVEATKLFARQGFHKTTVSEIANAIGMTQGAFFHHFPNKRALLDAVVEGRARGIESYRAVLKDKGRSAATVRKVVDLMVEHFNKNPEATTCLAALTTEFAGTDDPSLAKIRQACGIFIDTFETILENHPAVRDPRAAAIAFFGAVQGIAIQGLLQEKKVPIDKMANAFLRMIHFPKKW
jgi:AcrR family transcriptional regulator